MDRIAAVGAQRSRRLKLGRKCRGHSDDELQNQTYSKSHWRQVDITPSNRTTSLCTLQKRIKEGEGRGKRPAISQRRNRMAGSRAYVSWRGTRGAMRLESPNERNEGADTRTVRQSTEGGNEETNA